MFHDEALEVIEGMCNAAVTDAANLQARIDDLRLEYKQDPWEGTASQISRLEVRLAKKVREVQALALAETELKDA